MITAIIQARMGSTRLPGKVTMDLCGQPMLLRQLKRIQNSRFLEQIIVATTYRADDIPIINLARDAGFITATGSVDDVLDRFYQAAKTHSASVIVRMTGDCPLIDPKVIDKVIQYYFDHKDKIDHVCLDPKWPDGFGVEVFSFSLLEQAWQEATKLYEREHVTPYIYLSGRFQCHRIPSKQDLSQLRLTVDEPIDYQVIREIYENLSPKHGDSFGLDHILKLYNRRPELFKANNSILRNAGFVKSITAERKVLRFDPNPILKNSQHFNRYGGHTVLRLARGKGSRVWDLDGNEYIDYQMDNGSAILGHDYPNVVDNESSTIPHDPSALESKLVQLLESAMPWVETGLFTSTKDLARAAAISISRAHIGRMKILLCRHKFGPKDSAGLDFPYNDLSAVENLFQRHHNEIAAVIIEPYQITASKPGFLANLKELTHKHGALLVYDETSAGLRFGLGAYSEADTGPPDIVVFGNTLANGLKIGAVMGPQFLSNTSWNNETIISKASGRSLAEAITTVEELQDQGVYSHIWEMGSKLIEGYKWLVNDLQFDKHTWMVGLPPFCQPIFKDQNGEDSLSITNLFKQENLKRGVLVDGPQAISHSHTGEDLDMTLAAYYEALEIIKTGLDRDDIESLLEDLPFPPPSGLPR